MDSTMLTIYLFVVIASGFGIVLQVLSGRISARRGGKVILRADNPGVFWLQIAAQVIFVGVVLLFLKYFFR
jgi:hypothetical protein